MKQILRKSLARALCVATLVTAVSAADATVYFTPRGKTYHQSPACMALSRARTVYHAQLADAQKHGLKECGICWRPKKAAAKAEANGWAKPPEKK